MHSSVEFIPINSQDHADLYAKYRSALLDVIENTFGWNEEFQQERFKNRYELDWFHWIEVSNVRVGYICFFEKASEIHLSLLIVDAESRDRGNGRLAMNHLHALARADRRMVTLSSFRKNAGAINFYERLGYIATGGDENFIDMVLAAP